MTSNKLIVLVGGALGVAAFTLIALTAPWRVVVLAAVVLLGCGILLVSILVRRSQQDSRELIQRVRDLVDTEEFARLTRTLERRDRKLERKLEKIGAVTARDADSKALLLRLAEIEQELPERLAVRVAADLARLRRSLES